MQRAFERNTGPGVDDPAVLEKRAAEPGAERDSGRSTVPSCRTDPCLAEQDASASFTNAIDAGVERRIGKRAPVHAVQGLELVGEQADTPLA